MKWFKKLPKFIRWSIIGIVSFFALIFITSIVLGVTGVIKPQPQTDQAKTTVEEPKKAETKKATPPKTQAPKQETQKPKPPADIYEYSKFVVHEELGQKTSYGTDRFYDSTTYYDGSLVIFIYADDNLTKNATKTGIYKDIIKMVPTVFRDRSDVNKLTLNFMFPAENARGNTMEITAANVQFTRENNATINWANVVYKNIPIIADEFRWHSTFQGE